MSNFFLSAHPIFEVTNFKNRDYGKSKVFYQSKKGTTGQFGTEIGNFLKKKYVQTEILPLNEVNNKGL